MNLFGGMWGRAAGSNPSVPGGGSGGTPPRGIALFVKELRWLIFKYRELETEAARAGNSNEATTHAARRAHLERELEKQ